MYGMGYDTDLGNCTCMYPLDPQKTENSVGFKKIFIKFLRSLTPGFLTYIFRVKPGIPRNKLIRLFDC